MVVLHSQQVVIRCWSQIGGWAAGCSYCLLSSFRATAHNALVAAHALCVTRTGGDSNQDIYQFFQGVYKVAHSLKKTPRPAY